MPLTKFSVLAPESFICPITHEIMIDPVFTSDGYTFDRAAIAEWLKTKNTNPLTNQPLEHASLTTNRGLKSEISQFIEQNRRALGNDLIKAAKEGDAHAVNLLLELSINPNVTDLTGWSALHHAAAEGKLKVIEMLIKTGGNINQATAAIQLQVDQELEKKSKELMDLQQKLKDLNFQLEYSEYLETKNTLEKLMSEHYKGRSKRLASCRGDSDKIDSLENHYSLEDTEYRNIHYSIKHQELFILAKNKAFSSGENFSPLYYNHSIDPTYVNLMKDAPKIDRSDIQRQSRLVAEKITTIEQTIDCLKTLSCDVKKCTPLFLAIYFGHVDVIKLLLTAKASFMSTDSSISSLIMAVRSGKITVVKLILEMDTSANSENSAIHISLNIARALDFADIVELLEAHIEEKKILLQMDRYLKPLLNRIEQLESIIHQIHGTQASSQLDSTYANKSVSLPNAGTSFTFLGGNSQASSTIAVGDEKNPAEKTSDQKKPKDEVEAMFDDVANGYYQLTSPPKPF